MTEVANSDAQGPPLLPRSVSALRPPKPVPKRVPTRIFIVDPKASNTNGPAASARSGTSSVSPDLAIISSPWSRKLILTLDGGGIRGYSSLITLRALMKEIARIEETMQPPVSSSAETSRIPSESIPPEVLRPGVYLPSHYFDYIAGTSFGGLIAIMLGMLGMSVKDCIAEFQRQNKAIPLTNNIPGAIEFPLLHRPSTWPTKKSSSFYDTFAKFAATATTRSAPPSTNSATTTPRGTPDSTVSEFSKNSYQCQTLAWCTEVESRARRPYAFCSYEEHDASERLVSIPEVAKAITTPSSSSFKPFKLGSGQFVDGSKQIRDPTIEVIKEITALLDVSGEPAIELLLSLGTDEHTAWFYEKLRKHEKSSEVSGENRRSLREYHRFEVSDIKLGLRKKYYLREIEEATEKWLEGQQEQLRRYAEMLVKHRRARAETSRWETFALGVKYYCFHEECKAKDVAFDSRGKFYDHLERNHQLRKEAASDADIEAQLDRGRRLGCAEL